MRRTEMLQEIRKMRFEELYYGSEVEEERCTPMAERAQSFAGDDVASGWEHA